MFGFRVVHRDCVFVSPPRPRSITCTWRTACLNKGLRSRNGIRPCGSRRAPEMASSGSSTVGFEKTMVIVSSMVILLLMRWRQNEGNPALCLSLSAYICVCVTVCVCVCDPSVFVSVVPAALAAAAIAEAALAGPALAAAGIVATTLAPAAFAAAALAWLAHMFFVLGWSLLVM